MPFSAAPSITQTQQQAFLARWTASAKTAGSQLGIPYQWVLSQWAYESGWGTHPNGTYNVAGIGGAGNPVNFSSQSAFVKEYVSSIRSDFARQIDAIQVQRVSVAGRGGSPPVTIEQFFNGPNRYDPANTQYGSDLAPVLKTVESLTGTHVAGANPNLVAEEPGKVPGPSWLASLEAWAGKEAIFVALILGLVVILVLMAAKGLGLIGKG